MTKSRKFIYKTEEEVVAAAYSIMEASVLTSDFVTSSKDTVKLFQLRLALKPNEVFSVAFLNSQHQVIAIEDLFEGTINAATVYPREVVKRALELNAAACVLAHNHPSSVTTPSTADIEITDKIVAALNTVDIRVLDHVIVGKNSTFLFSSNNLI